VERISPHLTEIKLLLCHFNLYVAFHFFEPWCWDSKCCTWAAPGKTRPLIEESRRRQELNKTYNIVP
jgi:hypothetical protein